MFLYQTIVEELSNRKGLINVLFFAYFLIAFMILPILYTYTYISYVGMRQNRIVGMEKDSGVQKKLQECNSL